MNQTYEFHGYTIQAPNRSAIYKTVDSEDTVVVIYEERIMASIKFVNTGLRIDAENGILLQENKITIL